PTRLITPPLRVYLPKPAVVKLPPRFRTEFGLSVMMISPVLDQLPIKLRVPPSALSVPEFDQFWPAKATLKVPPSAIRMPWLVNEPLLMEKLAIAPRTVKSGPKVILPAIRTTLALTKRISPLPPMV